MLRVLRALALLGAAVAACVTLFVQCLIQMPGETYEGELRPFDPAETALAARLEGHVRVLAEGIGARNGLHPEALERAAVHVEEQLAAAGGERGRVERQEYRVGAQTFRNLALELPGTTRADEIVVVGAHYDSCFDTPGADDNASGVACLIELARGAAAGEPPARTLRFVAFASEEPPHFATAEMGSRHYARRCRERGEDVVAMVSLETLGYYRDDVGTQAYPVLLGAFYPRTGDFVAFVGNVASRRLVRRSIEVFRGAVDFPSEGLSAPSFLPGVWWSDHWSFWKEGYRAIMVTDTAPYRNPHYHGLGDVPDELDFPRLARVTVGLQALVAALASGDVP